MAAPEISVKLGAEIKDFTGALGLAQQQLIRLQKLISQPNLNFSQFERITALIKKTEGQINSFQGVTNRAGQSLGNIGPGANQATQALSNLSRVAQDAPFGFIGIANNLNPLLESFQRLKQSTGTTGSALKALGASLMGPAGLGIALSVVSSLFIAFGDEIGDALNGVDKFEKATRESAKAIDLARAGTAGEVAELKSLVSIASDESNSRAARGEALKKLQDLYPSYFENIKNDATLTTSLKGITDRLTQSILLNAQAKALQAEIDKSAAKVVEAGQEKQLTFLQKLKVASLRAAGVTATDIIEKDAAQKNYNETVSIETRLQEDLAKQLNATNAQLAKSGDLYDDKNKKTKTAEAILNEQIESVKRQIAAIEDLRKRGIATRGDIRKLFDVDSNGNEIGLKVDLIKLELPKTKLNPQQVDGLYQDLEKELILPKGKPLTVTIPDLVVQTAAEVGRNAALNINLPTPNFVIDTDKAIGSLSGPIQELVAQGKDSFQIQMEQLTTSVGEISAAAGADIAAAIGTNLGDAITGAFSGKSLLGSIGDIIGDALIAFGKLVIKTSVLLKALQEAVKKAFAANPVLGIIAGIAAVAAGQVIKNSFKAPAPKFAEGGVTASGPRSGYLAMLHGDELILPLGKGGADIGGRGDISVAPAVVFGYDNITIGVERVQKRRRRTGNN